MNLQCQICNLEFGNIQKLSNHIRRHHNIKSQEYYDKFFGSPSDGICELCQTGLKLRWVDLKVGYSKHHRSCGAKIFRNKLKNDLYKFTKFKLKVSKNQNEIWRNRNQSDLGKNIRNKIGNTIKLKNSKLSQTELNDKYGWLNKLTPDERKEKCLNILEKSLNILEKSLNKWWKNATEEEKNDLYKRRGIEISKANREKFGNNSELNHIENEFKCYAYQVRSLSNKNYNKYKKLINPENLIRGTRECDYHLDHKISVLYGFINKIPIDIISSFYNLELILSRDNLRKHTQCTLSLEELIKLCQNTDKEFLSLQTKKNIMEM